jgi:hemin uptake protein HemP
MAEPESIRERTPPNDPPGGAALAGKARRPPRNLDSTAILQGDSEITISHNGEIYRLRVTRNGKLILHK